MTNLERVTQQCLRFGSTDDSQCWPMPNNKGYGMVRVDGRLDTAHRVAYSITKGEIPEGLVVRHDCDNPPCFNPAHLFVGTHQDNVDDKEKKGRGVRVVDVGSLQRSKTHCPNGHPYLGDNCYATPEGHRKCRECKREADARYRERRRA